MLVHFLGYIRLILTSISCQFAWVTRHHVGRARNDVRVYGGQQCSSCNLRLNKHTRSAALTRPQVGQ